MTCGRCSHARNSWNWPARKDAGSLPHCRTAAKGLCRLLAAGCLGLSLVFPAYADNWQAPLVDEGLPSHLVAVDKHRQSFLFFERKSPLRLKYTFPCTTGQVPGDKQVINDKRTPEGIYFVEYKIASGLDFAEYGGVAYTLNYPNPVDRLRGKTGHGIWIHSKGFGIFPRDTRGCVAIGLQDIDTVGPSLVPGTAVVLAHAVDENNVPQRDDGTARYLRHRMQQWSDAWAARSEKMFDFYDGAAYSKATEDFGKFRQNKQRLFKMLSFIKIINRDIHVLQGPGYWVTWSEQFYTASNLSTEGVRRLYWQKDAGGEFRIVGMEWTPRDMGMLAEFKQGKLIAQALPVLSDGSEGPSRPALDMPESAADEKAATAAGSEQERLLAADALVPRNRPTQITGEINWGSGATLDTLRPDERELSLTGGEGAAGTETPQETAAPAQAQPETVAAGEPQKAAEAVTPPAPEPATPPPPPALELTPSLREELTARASAWLSAYAGRDTRAEALESGYYDVKGFNKTAGLPRGLSLAQERRERQRLLRSPWLRIYPGAQEWSVDGQTAHCRLPVLFVGQRGIEEGLRELWWQRGEDGVFRLVAGRWTPGEHGLSTVYLEAASGEASAMLERWRAAWEKADLDAYIACYTADALQQGRRGARNLRQQKQNLWQRVTPTLVQLSGMRFTLDRKGLRADMMQNYADSKGMSDRGTKTLLLEYDGTSWRIAREDWAAEPSAR